MYLRWNTIKGFPLHRDMSMINPVSNVETGVSKVEYNHGVSFA